MKEEIFTTELFYEYIKTRNMSLFDHKGYFIQEKNKFFIAIDSPYFKKFKNSLLNRRAEIIAEYHKTINKEYKTERDFLYIDCKNHYGRKSAKALFYKYELLPRKKRVLDPNYRERERQQWHIRNEKKQSRNKA